MRAPLLLLGWLLLPAAPLAAQLPGSSDEFGGNCAAASASARDLCFRVAEAVRILGARSTILLGAGNSVPGTASTLGMRMPGKPRLSIAARATAGAVELPPLTASAPGGELEFTPIALALDLGIGVFSGLTLGPTIGGFGSVDLIGSIGHVRLPPGDGLSGSVTSWAAGARFGVLRESFTAPGVSLSAVYRRLGDSGYGQDELSEQDAWFRLRDLSGWSLRAAVSKRLLGFGLTAGAGRDNYSARPAAVIRDTGSTSGRFELAGEELEIGRNTLFANASFTLLILHAVAELGWQSGGDEEPGIPTTGRLEQAGLYGGLAVRLSL